MLTSQEAELVGIFCSCAKKIYVAAYLSECIQARWVLIIMLHACFHGSTVKKGDM